ncbi:uncharacterized protein CANTADRAFT_24830, partial [Suhomyces tanzawaensis NRRL Y-17324]
MDDQIKLTIKALAQETTADVFNGQKHDQYIELLRLNRKDNLAELLHARRAKLQHYTLSREEFTEWLEDLSEIEDNMSRLAEVVELYGLILKTYPTAPYWKNYLNFILEIEDSEVSEELIRDLFTQALKEVADDYKDGSLVWEIILEHLSKDIPTTHIPQSPAFRMVLALHKKRLLYPSLSLDESFSQFLSFISKYDQENYIDHMRESTEIVNRTKRAQRYIEKHELGILKDPSNPQLYIEYLESIHTHMDSSDAGPLLNNVFRRFLYNAYPTRSSLQNPSKENLQVWLTYIYCLYERQLDEDKDTLELTVLDFVHTYPESPISYSELIRSCPTSDVGYEVFKLGLQRWDSVKRVVEDDGSFQFPYDEWKVLAIAILHFRLTIVQEAKQENSKEYQQEINALYQDIHAFVDYAILQNHDIFHSVEKLSISICIKLGNLKTATLIIDELIRKFPDQSDVWLYAIQFHKDQSMKPQDISRIYYAAAESATSVEGFEKIVEEWLQHEHVFGDVYSIRNAMVVSNKQLKRLAGLEAAIEEDVTTQVEKEVTKKRKLSDAEEIPTRSRETFTILVSNLPISTTKANLETFFNDCGEIRDIVLFQNSKAIVEFSHEQEVFTALTKNMKKLDGNTIRVERKLESTVFVTNYPPSISQDSIRKTFSECGDIVSLRFPTQRSNHTRRFCYVEFATADQAKKAVFIFNGKKFPDSLTKRDYELKVAISQPTKLTHISERKVRLNNIPFTYNEEDIRKIFQDCGPIEKLIIPSSHRKRSKNQNNDGFAFLTFETVEATQRALNKNEFLVEGRKIEVSKQKSTNKDDFREFNDLSTIGLENVNDTLTSEQLKALLTEEFGPISRIKLFPKEKAAIVEFERASDSGNATMKSKFELGSTEATVRSKADIVGLVNGVSTEHKKPNLMVPASVQRKRRKQ